MENTFLKRELFLIFHRLLDILAEAKNI